MYFQRSKGTPKLINGATNEDKIYNEDHKQQEKIIVTAQVHLEEHQHLRKITNFNPKINPNFLTDIHIGTIFHDLENDKNNCFDKPPIVPALVENIKCNVLVDSGSPISCISKDFYEQILQKNKNILTLPVSNVKIIGATGGKSKNISQQIFLRVQIQNFNFENTFLIVEQLIQKIIIGRDCLKKAGVIMDFQNDCITVGDCKIPFFSFDDSYFHKNDNLQYQLTELDGNISKNTPITIKNLIKNYEDIFSEKPGRTSAYIHKIRLADDSPFKPRTYPIPMCHRELVKDKIQQMLDWKIIRKSETPYISPLVAVIKKDKSVRVCLDAQALNKKIVMDYECPLPAEHLLLQVNKKLYFSTIDLTSSFWQIGLSTESTKYCGFVFENEVFEYLVMPFGLKTAVAGMSRCINIIFGDCKDFVICYIDDLLITSESEEEHYKHLYIVFQKLREANLTVNLSKCKFFRDKLPFLGHILTTEGVKTDPDKMISLKDFPKPKNIRNLRAFLGICNYHRRFCPNYSQTLYPLYQLLKKGSHFHWTTEHDSAFQFIKEKIINASLLYHPDRSKEFYIQADASAIAIGGRLFQIINNNEHTIAFISRKLTQPEINYNTTERELLAIIYCLDKWKTLLLEAKIIILSDHKSLSFLLNCQLLNPRLSRWYLKMMNFNFEIKYITGKSNIIADSLSRYSYEDLDGELRKDVVIATSRISIDKNVVKLLKQIKNLQERDEILSKIIQNLRINANNSQSQYLLHNNILFCKDHKEDKWKISVPNIVIKELVNTYHNLYGHFGAWKTYKALAMCYTWKNMRNSVKKIVRACELCQKSKYTNQVIAGTMKAIIPKNETELLAVDVFGPLPPSIAGVKYVFVVLNVFTKYVKLYTIKKPTARILISKLENDYFQNVRKPASILSDNGSQFTSKIWNKFLEKQNIKNFHCSIRHPQSNPSERVMRELGRLLRLYCHQKHTAWAKFIYKIETLLNCATHDSTGVPPILLEKNTHPELEIKNIISFPEQEQTKHISLELIKERLYTKSQKRIQKHDSKLNKITTFAVGQYVWLKSNHLSCAEDHEAKKLFLLYEGPFRIKKVVGHNAYELVNESNCVRGIFNVVSLKPYISE